VEAPPVAGSFAVAERAAAGGDEVWEALSGRLLPPRDERRATCS